jgi:hypothetical protein
LCRCVLSRNPVQPSSHGRAVPFKDPEARRDYQRSYRQLQRAGRAEKPPRPLLPSPLRLRTAQELLGLLEEQINAVRMDGALGTVERARCVGSLAGVALRAVETADLERRLIALEAVLNSRRPGARRL